MARDDPYDEGGRCAHHGRTSGPDFGLLHRKLSGTGSAEGGHRRRARQRQIQGLGDADAGLAPARSAGDARRHDLVVRPVRQPARPAQSEDRRDEGVSDPGAGRSARPDQRQGRQHLVRGQLGRPHRQARSEDRRVDALRDARSEGEGPAHAAVRQERHPLVQRAERRLHGPARSRRPATSSCSRRSARPVSSPMRCVSCRTNGGRGSAISARTRSRPSIPIRSS